MSVTDASTTQRSRGDAAQPDCHPPVAATGVPTALAYADDACRSMQALPPRPRPSAPAHSSPCALPWDREAAARRTLRRQVAKLETDLARLVTRARACDAIDWSVPAPPPAGPRLLDLGELERLRDDLADRLHDVEEVLAARAAREAERRALLERMLRDPAEHRFLRITRAEVGEPGCGAWESRPRLGLIGMLAGWWHIKISSGCPLSRAAHQL